MGLAGYRQLKKGREHRPPLPLRTALAMALQRLGAPSSDPAGSAWDMTVEAPGFKKLAWQHFYCTAAFLAEVRGGDNRDVAGS